MVVALDLYMDAPEMSLPLSQHDLHSKPLAVALYEVFNDASDETAAKRAANAAKIVEMTCSVTSRSHSLTRTACRPSDCRGCGQGGRA